jgi:hypothetical protein
MSASRAVLVVVCLSGPAAVSFAQSSPPDAGETAVESVLMELRNHFRLGLESKPFLCEQWLKYARATGFPGTARDFRHLQKGIPVEVRNTPDEVNMALNALVGFECPPIAQTKPGTAAAPAAPETKGGIGRKAVLIGGAAAALGAGLALAGGGSNSASTPPATPPASVTTYHGLYVGRLVTSSPSIPGCGREATAPCNAQVGGNTTGMPASLTFGGDLPSSGVLRPTGTMEGFRYEGPANGLAALPGGIIVDWRQQGTIANNVLTLDGTATVTSAGPCNGAVITTRVEATRN